MNPRYVLLSSCLAVLAIIQPAQAQDQTGDESSSLMLGTRLFETVCRASLGNPDEFHRLIAMTGLTKLLPDESPEMETWTTSVGRVSVAVQYTKTMACFVRMSHAKEADVQRYVINAIKAVFREGGSTVTHPESESKDSSVLRFNVSGPKGNYMLMALYRPGVPSLDRSALVIGPFK